MMCRHEPRSVELRTNVQLSLDEFSPKPSALSPTPHPNPTLTLTPTLPGNRR